MDRKLENKIKLFKKKAKTMKKDTAIVLTVTTQSFKESVKILPFRNLDEFFCLPLAIKDSQTGVKLAKGLDGVVDIFFVDIENKLKKCQNLFHKVSRKVSKSKVYPIKGNDFTAEAAFSLIFNCLGSLYKKKICIIGAGNIGGKLALKLIEGGCTVYVINSSKKSTNEKTFAINIMKPKECLNQAIPITTNTIPRNLDGMVGFTRGTTIISEKMIKHLKKGGLILDGGTGTVSEGVIAKASSKKIVVIRVDILNAFKAFAELAIAFDRFYRSVAGKKKINSFNVVAGGYLGEKGDVVVDNISKPTQIIGIANGKGKVIGNSDRKKIELVKRRMKMI